MPLSSKSGALFAQPVIKAKTAAYTVTADESGVIFTNDGATASVAFTLPPVTGLPIGTNYTFLGVTNAGFSVASNGSLDNIISKNDVAADSITCTTNSLAISARVEVIWLGTKWFATQASVGPTYTVA